MTLTESVSKLGIRALKQIVTAIHSLATFENSAKTMLEAYEDTKINKRYKGLQIHLNLALTEVSFSSDKCRLEGVERDEAIAHLLTQALADTERRRAKIAKTLISQSMEPQNDIHPEQLDGADS